MPYLILKDAAGFLSFAQEVFDATEKMKHMRSETEIMHAEIKIGESTIMLAEASEQWEVQTAGLFVYVEDAHETYQRALQNGAASILEPAQQSYGLSCGVKDPAGNTWWITSLV